MDMELEEPSAARGIPGRGCGASSAHCHCVSADELADRRSFCVAIRQSLEHAKAMFRQPARLSKSGFTRVSDASTPQYPFLFTTQTGASRPGRTPSYPWSAR
jgi:hypothetical protein